MQGLRHAFVVPAYGQSPYLRDCLASLRAQTRPSPIVISTSTPSRWLADQAAEFGATLVEHGPNRGIGHDWNQAIAASEQLVDEFATWLEHPDPGQVLPL